MEKLKATARLDWSLDITCPNCDTEIDLLDCANDEGEMSGPIFSNKWHDLEDFEIYCEKCEGDFLIETVEY